VTLLAAALTFTLPLHGAVGCVESPDLLRDSLQWRVSVRQQSAAWIAMRPAMLADPSVWAAIWPIVRAEAEPRAVASGTAAPGSRVSASTPDTLTAPHWYSAASRNGRGESCESNVVGK
jgi:hypothetical protein